MDSAPKTKVQIDSIASNFVNNLKTGTKLSSFFNEGWSFVYFEDNRCDGLTEGLINNLKKESIESNIQLEVKNDGEGWDCDQKEPKTYDLNFELKKKITNWDRFEISDQENDENNIITIVGAGISDYLKLHFNEKGFIIKLEYRSEDPG